MFKIKRRINLAIVITSFTNIFSSLFWFLDIFIWEKGVHALCTAHTWPKAFTQFAVFCLQFASCRTSGCSSPGLGFTIVQRLCELAWGKFLTALHLHHHDMLATPGSFLLANSLVRWEQEGVGVNTATLHLHTTPHCPMDSYVSTQTTYMLHLLTNTYTPLLTPCPGRPGAVSAFLTSVGAGHTWSDGSQAC